jgi:hypothetical protein
MDSEIDFHEAFRRVQRLFIEGKRWQCIRVGKEVLSENTIPPLLRIKIICIPANAEVNQRDADVSCRVVNKLQSQRYTNTKSRYGNRKAKFSMPYSRKLKRTTWNRGETCEPVWTKFAATSTGSPWWSLGPRLELKYLQPLWVDRKIDLPNFSKTKRTKTKTRIWKLTGRTRMPHSGAVWMMVTTMSPWQKQAWSKRRQWTQQRNELRQKGQQRLARPYRRHSWPRLMRLIGMRVLSVQERWKASRSME